MMLTQRSPRYRTQFGAPGRMCWCGHREGSHNDLARCCAGECSCGGYPHAPREFWGGFDPEPAVDDPKHEKWVELRAMCRRINAEAARSISRDSSEGER